MIVTLLLKKVKIQLDFSPIAQRVQLKGGEDLNFWGFLGLGVFKEV